MGSDGPAAIKSTGRKQEREDGDECHRIGEAQTSSYKRVRGPESPERGSNLPDLQYLCGAESL